MTSDISVGYQGLPIEDLAGVLRSDQGSFITGTNGLSYTDNTWIIATLDNYKNAIMQSNQPPNSGPADPSLSIFFSQLSRTTPYSIEDFAQAFVHHYNHNNQIYPGQAQLLEDNVASVIKILVKANLGIVNDLAELNTLDANVIAVLGAGNFSTAIANASLNTIGSGTYSASYIDNMVSSGDPRFPATFTDDLAEKAFTEALKNSAFFDLSVPANSNFALNIKTSLENYFVRFAFVQDYINTFVAFTQDPSQAPSLATSLANQLKDFISNILASDPSTTFRSSAEFGKWMQQLSQNYQASINGTTITVSSVGASMPKVRIIQRIYALIVEMIAMLQRTTAAQSQYLKVLTLQQSAMTDLVAKTHVFTSTDGSSIAVTGTTVTDAQTHRDELNQVVSAWVDGIKARRDFAKNEAQSAQSYLNNSNDAVNQQASMATALIQELSTLLGAIYR